MALARSASGPGGLSINTGPANLFGSSTSQPPAAGGLFGNTTSQPAKPSLFGTATSQPQATTSLFGGTATSQPQQGGSLFGATNNQTSAQPQQTGGLFGQTASQPQQTGGLFGSTATQQQQPQQATGGGLFGSTATQQPQQSGGLFGGTTVQQQPQQQATGGLFGGAPSQTQPQQGGLFGAPAQQQNQATGGLFGASNTNTGGMFAQSSARPQGGLFSGLGQSTAQPQQTGFGQSTQGPGLTMGQSTNQQSQVVPGVRIDVSNLRPTTRFNDLQEDLQNQIIAIDNGIQKCMRDKEAVDAFLPAHGEMLAAIPMDINFVARKFEGAHAARDSDVVAISQLRELAKADVENAKLSFKAIDNLRLPTQYHQAGLWSTRAQQSAPGAGSADLDAQSNADLISFFSKTADEMDQKMKIFESNLKEIEAHLHGVQANMLDQLQRVNAHSKRGIEGGVDERVIELASVLHEFEESILQVAGVVGGIKEGVTELQLKDFMGRR